MALTSSAATLLKVVTETPTLKHMRANTRVYATCDMLHVCIHGQLSEHRLQSIQRLFTCITDHLATTWSYCSGTGWLYIIVEHTAIRKEEKNSCDLADVMYINMSV